MAQKKKTSGTRSASSTGTKRKTTSSAAKRSSGGGRTAKETRRPIRREAAGLALLLLALCVFISFFNEDGWLIALLPMVLKGCFGWGYYVTVPALCVAGVILLHHRGRPVSLRVTGALLLPGLFGILCHLLFSRVSFEEVRPLIPALWNSGRELTGGGLLSGTAAIGFTAILGVGASVVIVLVLIAVMGMVAFDLTLEKLIQMWRDRERLKYSEEDYEDEDDFFESIREVHEVSAERKKKTAAAKKKRAQIDIPLDAPLSPGEKNAGGFFRPKGKDQLTPADLYDRDYPETEPIRETTPPVPAEPVFEVVPEPMPEPIPEPVSESIPEPIPEPILLTPVPEPMPAASASPVRSAPRETEPVRSTVAMQEEKPKSRKQAAEELEQTTAEVAAEIESGMAVEGEYAFPSVELLNQNTQDNYIEAGAELRTNAQRLADTLRSFGVDATAGEVIRGPAVTRYEFVLDQGVKLSKITNLADDIALALGASGVRIAPIPEKISVVGIEVPNKAVSPVLIRDVIDSQTFARHKSSVAFTVGRDIGNQDIVGDIAKLPHVLIAGTTGSGKSVCTNSLIISLLYKSSPEDVRFIMVDPKMVELAPYNGIPHLLIPVVTDPKKAAGALQWAVYEMMKRYKTFSEIGVKKLEEYNAVAARRDDLPHMASVVVVIDELADLMLVAAKEVEESICRVAQMGRAAGMHLVIATQRPSADVITGLMKANIPSRIAFAVASSLESRIILDAAGAEKLVGRGDMLYAPLGSGKPQRVQGCFITPEEIDRVVSFVKSTGEAQYSDEIMQKIEESMKEKDKKGGAGGASAAASASDGDACDEMFPAAVEVILETGQASVSMLQRRLKLGYSRAARLVDQMEERGIVGPFEGSKPRQLLITKERWQEMQMGSNPNELTAEEASGFKTMNWDDGEHVIPWEEQE